MKLFVFLLITWGVAMSFPLENESRTEKQDARDPVKLEKKLIEESGSKRTRRWLWRNYPPPFFAGDKRPQNLPNIANEIEIKQTLPTDPSGTPPYFVTLFDQARNIPFYSAYKVTPAQAKRMSKFSRKQANTTWREPPGSPVHVPRAVNSAYTTANSAFKSALGPPPGRRPFGIDRGHMNPSAINSFNLDFMSATFTLTNSAPQFATSNQGPWQDFETRIRSYATTNCSGIHSGTLYLLTGTSEYGLRPNAAGTMVQDISPYQIPLPFQIPNNAGPVPLVIPQALWTAGCCVWQEPGAVFGYWWPRAEAASFAVMTNNQDDPNRLYQTPMSVADLEVLLTAPNSPRVNLFPGYAACHWNTVII